MRLFPTTTVPNCANANDEGVMYYDDTINVNQLMVCRETAPGIYGWGMAGSNWTHPAGTDILHTNDNNWNVGIGTTTPTQKLDVAGYVRGQSGLCIGNDCRTSWPGTKFYVIESTAHNPTLCCNAGDVALSWAVNDVDVHAQYTQYQGPGPRDNPRCISYTGYATGSNNKQVLCVVR
ncbi:MAG: hypothetical protein Q8O13_01140 [Candidatus Omnitrophota bacterium]|nr:hypothetical protein [Candidatus Omnitrophota bacterium]